MEGAINSNYGGLGEINNGIYSNTWTAGGTSRSYNESVTGGKS